MNLVLEKLLENEFLDDKDRYEIRQIFDAVSDDKKQNIINNFDKIVASLLEIKKELKESQEILLGRAISNIETLVKKASFSGIKQATSSSINDLKKTIGGNYFLKQKQNG